MTAAKLQGTNTVPGTCRGLWAMAASVLNTMTLEEEEDMLKQELLSGSLDKCEGQDVQKVRTEQVGVRKPKGNGQAQ